MKLFEIRTGPLTPTYVMARDQRHALDLLAEHQPVTIEQTITIIPLANFIAGSTPKQFNPGEVLSGVAYGDGSPRGAPEHG